MSFVRAAGFALICSAVALGVDFYQQSKSTTGNLSLSSYLGTVTERMEGFRSDRRAAETERERQKRWREGGKPFLPDAPEGWMKRAIADREFDVGEFPSVRKESASKAAAPLVVSLARKEAAQRVSKFDKQGWVYERGDETVWIRVGLHQPANANSLTGLVATTLGTMSFSDAEHVPVGVIGGVSYVERVSDTASMILLDNWSMVKAGAVEADGIPYRQITGRIGFGQEISLHIFTDAPHASVRQILQQIDYDGLNGLLAAPVPTVGNDVEIPLLRQPELAMAMMKLRAEFNDLRARAARQRLEHVDPHALMLNTAARGHGLPDGMLDLTAGEIPNMATLLQVGYRQGLAALMQEDRRKADSGIGGFLTAMVDGADAETLPARSEPKPAGAPEKEEKGGGLQWLLGSSRQASAGGIGSGGEVRVNKGGGEGGSGGFGKGSCQQVGAMKRCSAPGG